jgi:hypothetical protein
MSTAATGRKIVGGAVPNRVPVLSDISGRNALARHVRARCQETIRFCTNLAYLRMKGVIVDGSTSSMTGAAYQDARGTVAYPRAHVLPGNLCINGQNIPDLVSGQPRLMAELTAPLKRTDMLPVLYNYADRLFEDSGGIDALLAVSRWIASEQRVGQPIGPMLIDEAYYRHAVLDYGEAYIAAAGRAATMSETDWGKVVRGGGSRITEGADQGFIMIDADATDYRTKRDDAASALRFAAHVNSELHPSGTLPRQVQDRIDLLESLGGSAL